mmetsp:Transcript_7001/g.26449  ORF Transcript_7001/g.26449 Transcript_7001/m.26449 type:complete len:231 (+) Transcript_7001:436-1128(+)
MVRSSRRESRDWYPLLFFAISETFAPTRAIQANEKTRTALSPMPCLNAETHAKNTKESTTRATNDRFWSRSLRVTPGVDEPEELASAPTAAARSLVTAADALATATRDADAYSVTGVSTVRTHSNTAFATVRMEPPTLFTHRPFTKRRLEICSSHPSSKTLLVTKNATVVAITNAATGDAVCTELFKFKPLPALPALPPVAAAAPEAQTVTKKCTNTIAAVPLTIPKTCG